MIPLESILEASATMIIGILFIITIARAMGWTRIEDIFLLFCLFGIVPFTITAILALLELNEPARWMCIISFVLFAFFLTFGAYATVTE